MSSLTIVFTVGIVETKFGLVRLPCLLFIVLIVLVFIESLGDRSLNITSGTVGELYACSYSGASVESSNSSSPSEIN